MLRPQGGVGSPRLPGIAHEREPMNMEADPTRPRNTVAWAVPLEANLSLLADETRYILHVIMV